MNPTIIIISYPAITVWRDGKLIDTSPEIATLSESDIFVSHEVTVEKINNSQAIYRHYWCELGEEPLSHATPNFRHNGDLAYKHLEGILARIGMPTQVIISVPSYYNDSQLSLLLGICKALRLPIRSFVDSNVAALACEGAPSEYLLVDIKKDESSVSQITITDNVTRKKVSTIPNVGTEKIYANCSGIIAKKFLEQTRYDPLHEIASEHSLIKNLPSWLTKLYARKELIYDIEHDGEKRSASIPTAEIIDSLKKTLLPITRALPNDKTILIAPSIFEIIKGAGIFPEYQTLTLHDSQRGITRNLDIFPEDVNECPFIVEMPSTNKPSTNYSIQPILFGIDPSSATHILSGSRAQTLSTSPVYIRSDGEFSSSSNGPYVAGYIKDNHAMLESKGIKASVNGMTVVDKCKLKIGDKISMDDGKGYFIAIHVTGQNGAQ
jgi:hypothetical protein